MKRGLTVLSLSPFCLMIFLRNMYLIPVVLFHPMTPSEYFFGLMSLFVSFSWLIISSAIYTHFLFDVNMGISMDSYIVEEATPLKTNGIDLAVMIIVALLIKDVHLWYNGVLFLLILILSFVTVVKTNLYYMNSTLSVLGYKTYQATIKRTLTKKESSVPLLSRAFIKEGEIVLCTPITKKDQLWFTMGGSVKE